MKTVLSSLFFFFVFISSAQYQPTAVEGRRWNQYLHPNMLNPLHRMYYQEFNGDTLFKGTIMKKLVTVDNKGQFERLDAIVYEDTSAPSLTY